MSKMIKNLNSKIEFNNIKISPREKINFLEQLWNLLQSWIPLINSLKIIIYQTNNKKIKNIIEEIIRKLNKWDDLTNILEAYPKIFWTFDTSIIRMWEITWKLWDSIETIKIKEEKTKELKWKIVQALIYPIVIICLSIIMIWVFMIYVIPKIQEMYNDSKVNLPSLTQGVINMSNFIQENIIMIVISIIVFIILVTIFKTSKLTKIYYDNLIIRIPIFGPLIKKKILALFSQSLWVLLKNWVIINKSLEISSKALENDYYEKALTEINSWVSKWIELSTLMWINEIQSGKENFLFPIELSSVVKIWEETWNLANLLIKISIKMDKEINDLIKNIQSAVEPMVIIIVWWIVWTIIMAIMLPFFNMVNVI